jgi:hypothetical protein
MERAPECADPGGRGGEKIRTTGRNHPDSGSGTVLLVVGVKQENKIECLDDFGFEFAILTRIREHHVKKVFGVFEGGFRVDRGQSMGLPVGESGDGADLGNQARGVVGESFLPGTNQVRVVR